MSNSEELFYRKKLIQQAHELEKLMNKEGLDGVAKETFTARRKRRKLTKLLERKVRRQERREKLGK